MKLAVVNCADTGPLESLAVMLRAAGYETRPLSCDLAVHLRQLGLDNVRTINQTMAAEGVERPFDMREATIADLPCCHLYVDVKAHRNGPRLWDRYPGLKTKTLWYLINGGKPDSLTERDGYRIDCPVLTPNLWYRGVLRDGMDGGVESLCNFVGRAYTMWPPFYRFDEYLPQHPRRYPKEGEKWGNPMCLVHNLKGWGFGSWANGCRALGVRIYGRGSPDGLVDHATLKSSLSKSVAMVHLKHSDAPGYALYEALSAGCPVVVSERLVKYCRMQELFVDEETCLFFDRLSEPDLTPSNLGPDDVAEGVAKICRQLYRLLDPTLNARIGLAGRERLRELMWREDRDGPGFAEWMRRQFP